MMFVNYSFLFVRTAQSCVYILAEEFILEDPKSYAFLSSRGHLPVPGVDDVAEFQATCKAMSIMGMTNDDFSGKY
jgi:myosin heavy subunit